MKTLLCLALIGSASLAIAQVPVLPVAPPVDPTPKQIEDFASAVLPYAVGERFHKWSAPPRISLCDAAVDYKPVASQFVADVGPLVPPSVAPILVDDNLTSADILLIIGSPSALAQHRLREHSPSTNKWQASWNGDQSIKRFVIYLDATQFKSPTGTGERRVIYASLLKALGLSGDHTYPPIKSIWGTWNEGTPQSALWENDKKLVGFAYNSVPNNASRTDIRALVKKDWK